MILCRAGCTAHTHMILCRAGCTAHTHTHAALCACAVPMQAMKSQLDPSSPFVSPRSKQADRRLIKRMALMLGNADVSAGVWTAGTQCTCTWEVQA